MTPPRPITSSTLLWSTPTTTKRLSPSCQQVLEETFTDHAAQIVIRSCLADSQLYPIISGHKCNKVALCPSSLWADMALTVGAYIWETLRPKTELPGLNVCDMESHKGFIVQLPQVQPGQFVELEADAQLEGDGGVVRCQWRSVNPDGTKIADHASCLVRYENQDAWRHELSRIAHMVRTSIKDLQQRALTGKATRMQSGLAYKVFETFVTYSNKYRGMNEVIFDGLEGCATLEFKTSEADYTMPFHIDNSCHLSGFLCNASDLDGDDVYVSEGWEGLKCLKSDLFTSTSQPKMTKYVMMQPRARGILQGDVYVLLDGDVVAVWEGLKFKRLPRRVVNIFLPPPKTT